MIKYFYFLVAFLYFLTGCSSNSTQKKLEIKNDEQNKSVINQNTPPQAVSKTYNIDEDNSVEITLEGSDLEDEILTFSVVQSPKNGIYQEGIYIPNENFFGTDSITYIANDGQADSIVATIFINVKSINDAPIVDLEDDLDVLQNTEYLIRANVSDPDNDEFTYKWTENGQILGSGNSYNIQNLSYGNHTLTVLVSDNDGLTATDTVNVKISKYVLEKSLNLYDTDYYYTYDQDGNIIEERTVYYSSSVSTYFEYDSHRNMTKKYDNNKEYTYTYDKKDQLIREEFRYKHDEIHYVTYYIYDERGNLLQELVDTNSDGKFIGESVYTYTYDDNNNMLSKKFSWGLDVITENLTTYTYDKNNNLVQEEYEIFESAHNYYGMKTTIFYAYDDFSNLTEKREVNDYDPNHQSVYYYAYDTNNNLINRTFGTLVNGSFYFHSETNYEYDERDNLIVIDRGFKTIFEYDENDNLIRQTGGTETPSTYIYDEHNNLLQKVADDGTIKQEQSWIRI